MKKMILMLLSSLVSTMLAAEPVKALLVVQNHSAVKDAAVLTSIGDQFVSALGDELFEIINPNDVIGDTQNVGPWGEKMPVSSAVRLAESCGADILLTASLTDISRKDIGVPPIAGAVEVTWSVAAKRVPVGSTICSVTISVSGKQHVAKMLEANFERIKNETLRTSVQSAAEGFLAKVKTKNFVPRKIERVNVAFVANLAGADIKIDGVSVGIAGTDVKSPCKILVSKGLHNLEIAYPFMIPYKTTVRFDNDSTFVVNLRESADGRALRQGDQKLAVALERIVQGGATDDDVMLIKAKGYAKCLEASSFKIEGMPERLTVVEGGVGSLGLGLIQQEAEKIN